MGKLLLILPVHNLGAGGNTPEYWRPPPRGLGHPYAMFNAVFLSRASKPSWWGEVRAWVDSGGFLLIEESSRRLASPTRRSSAPSRLRVGDWEELVEEVLRVQCGWGAEVAMTLDYPLEPGVTGAEAVERIRVSARNAATAYQLRRGSKPRLYVVLQYRSRSELKLYLEVLEAELRSRAGARLSDVDGFAVGGLVPYRHRLGVVTNRVRLAREVAGDKPIHVLGVASPLNTPLIAAAGATSADSKTFIIAAAKRLWYAPPEHYAEGRLPARIEARKAPRLKPSEYCSCPACSSFDTLAEMAESTRSLALHNLHVTLKSAARWEELLPRVARRSTRVAAALRAARGVAPQA